MDANAEETYKFESTVVGGAIPKEYIPAVGEGIEEASKSWYPGWIPGSWCTCKCIRRILPRGRSSEMAFHIAGSMAFKDAMKERSGTA